MEIKHCSVLRMQPVLLNRWENQFPVYYQNKTTLCYFSCARNMPFTVVLRKIPLGFSLPQDQLLRQVPSVSDVNLPGLCLTSMGNVAVSERDLELSDFWSRSVCEGHWVLRGPLASSLLQA